MSVGYADSPGTGGQYFRLSNASQIPQVVVSSVLSSTQVANRLTLKVTNEFSDWVTFTPAEFTNVGPNVTVTSTISVTVPDGTQLGFYPFMIQAVADGTILDVSYVEVTVPTDSPVSDIGFRPDRDGYSFPNFSSSATWEMFEQFFGKENIYYPNGDVIFAADLFFDQSYSTVGGGGSCDGFSATSLLNYYELSQPHAGVYAMPRVDPLHSTTNASTFSNAISFAQAIQKGVEAYYQRSLTCERLENSPAGMYRYLKSLIQNNSPALIAISWSTTYTSLCAELPPGAHALVPYRFEEPSSDRAIVYVYDSNFPGRERQLEFDLSGNGEWVYDWHVPLCPDIRLQGSADTCSIMVTPLELYRHQGVPYWSVPTESVRSTTAETQGSTIFTAAGSASLLFIDDQGRRLGWDNEDVFHDEIPGATYFPVAATATDGRAGLYYIPADQLLDVFVQGSGEGDADISVFGDNYMVALTDMAVLTDTTTSLRLTKDGSGIEIGNASGFLQTSIIASQILTEEDRTIRVSGVELGSGQLMGLDMIIDQVHGSDSVQLSSNVTSTKTLGLSLIRSGGEGLSTFGNDNFIMDPNAIASVEINNWSSLDSVNVNVDLDQDGTMDQVRTLDNVALVGTIQIESPTSQLVAGSNAMTLLIRVKDQFGNPVANDTPLSINSTSGIVSPTATSTIGGNVSAVFTPGDNIGITTITVTSGSVEAVLDIEIIAGPPASVTVTGEPSAIVAGGSSTSIISTTVNDAFDNPVSGQVVSFTTTLGSIPAQGVTDVAGVVTTTLTSATSIGVAAVTATASDASGETQVTFIAGPPISVTVTSELNTLVADGSSTSVVTTIVKDAFDNSVSGQVVSFTTTLGSIPAQGVTDVAGVVTTTLTSATSLGTATVTTTAGDAISETQVMFIAGVPAVVTVTGEPSTLVADGSSTSIISTTVKDAFDNPVSGQVVSFTTTLGSIPAHGVTDVNGVVTTTLTSATSIGTATVTATAGAAVGETQVMFIAGSPTSLTVTGESNTLVADGSSTSVVTATVKDAFENPVSGQVVSFTATLGSIPAQGVTGINGVVTTTLTSASSTGIATVTATAGGISGELQIRFVAGAAWSVSLVSTSEVLLANGIDTSTITATVRDSFDNIVPSQIVTFQTDWGSVTPSSTTNGVGEAVAVFTSTTDVVTATITAQVGQTEAHTTIRLVGGSISGAIFLDQNGNGVKDLSELGVPGISVHATQVADGRYWETYSGPDGAYLLRDLPISTYQAEINVPAPYVSRSMSSFTVDISDGGASTPDIAFQILVFLPKLTR